VIDHVSVAVRDLERATRFYEAVLGAIGYERLETRPHTVGFGKKYPEFWINLRAAMASLAPDSGAHVGLRVRSVELVDASTTRRLRRAARPTARRGCGRSTARAITPPSSAIPTAIASKR
jgi:catechol 2,3-dioxygenase-like lactoylglutathione lyase family enzyme